jgi:hypothetical protein
VQGGQRRDQLAMKRLHAFEEIDIARRPADIDLKVAPNGPTQWLQRLHKYVGARTSLRIITCTRLKHANTSHTLCLLCVSQERPRPWKVRRPR